MEESQRDHITPRNELQRLSGKERLEVVLGLFGTDVARKNFLDKCRAYNIERKQSVPTSDGKNYQTKGVKYSLPKRAFLHNSIMDTISRLGVQTKKLSALQREVLSELASREEVARCIRDYVVFEEGRDDDNEDEQLPTVDSSSNFGASKWHTLGREH